MTEQRQGPLFAFLVPLPAAPARPLIDAEAAKCVLACANCHHRKTHRYGEGEEEE